MNLNACYQCGECTAVCPMRRVSKFSPRSFIEMRHEIIGGASHEEWRNMCLLCGACYMKCPQCVDFPQFIIQIRSSLGVPDDVLAHRELSLISEIMSSPSIRSEKTELKGETSNKSDIGYFPGCLPYFDLFMDVSGVNYREIGDYSVKLLNIIGIKPRILPLKCCGHDMLFQGKRDVFERLMNFNRNYVRENDIKMIVFSCAEGYYTFKRYYDMDVEIVHISRLLAEHAYEIESVIEVGNREREDADSAYGESGCASGGEKLRVAYHDPCALKMLREYDAPREVLRRISCVDLVELPHARDDALCCGVSGMMFCNDLTKALRTLRMNEVREVGADFLVTTCVKCLSHFNCLKMERMNEMRGGTYNFEIMDLSVFLGKLIDGSIVKRK